MGLTFNEVLRTNGRDVGAAEAFGGVAGAEAEARVSVAEDGACVGLTVAEDGACVTIAEAHAAGGAGRAN